MSVDRVYTRWADGRHLSEWLFDQDDLWVTARSEAVKVAEMTPQHALNTLLMLERMEDLPIEFLQERPLYQALKARVLEFLPPEPELSTDTTVSISLGEHTLDLKSDAELRAEAERPSAVRFVTEPLAVLATLRNSIGSTVTIDYTDARGNETTRRVTPTKVEERRVGLGFKQDYLIAFDEDKGEPRTFKVRSISRVEQEV